MGKKLFVFFGFFGFFVCGFAVLQKTVSRDTEKITILWYFLWKIVVGIGKEQEKGGGNARWDWEKNETCCRNTFCFLLHEKNKVFFCLIVVCLEKRPVKRVKKKSFLFGFLFLGSFGKRRLEKGCLEKRERKRGRKMREKNEREKFREKYGREEREMGGG